MSQKFKMHLCEKKNLWMTFQRAKEKEQDREVLFIFCFEYNSALIVSIWFEQLNGTGFTD